MPTRIQLTGGTTVITTCTLLVILWVVRCPSFWHSSSLGPRGRTSSPSRLLQSHSRRLLLETIITSELFRTWRRKIEVGYRNPKNLISQISFGSAARHSLEGDGSYYSRLYATGENGELLNKDDMDKSVKELYEDYADDYTA